MRLLELREEKNLTQEDIAKAINTSRTNIGRWEKGINEPSASLIIQLADFFRCSIDYLLEREDDYGNISININETFNCSSKKRELIELFDTLSSEYQSQLLEYARYIAERNKNTKTISKK